MTVDSDTTHCPICYKRVQPTAYNDDLHWDSHLERCTPDGGNACRHNDFQTAVRDEAKLLGQPSQLGNKAHIHPHLSADLVFDRITAADGKALLVDFSICNAMAANNQSDTPLKRATFVENIKNQKYSDLSHSKRIQFHACRY